jgi:RimJ/RimL family protein N-acetyltransferase
MQTDRVDSPSSLTLRDQTAADLPILHRWLHAEQGPEWRRWDGPYFFRSQQEPVTFEAYSARELAQPADEHSQIIALNGECIGFINRHEEAPVGGGWWELGIVIFDPAYWSGGYGTRALELWVAATFRDTAAHVFTLTTWSGNVRMCRAAERLGLRECARIPEARAWDGQRWDSLKFGVLRREWAGSRRV